MAAGSKPVKQVDIARELKLAPATVNRIIKTLSDRGYLFRTSQKYCICNFRLTRNVPMSEEYLSILNSLMDDIPEEHQVYMEAVVATGFDFIWHSRTGGSRQMAEAAAAAARDDTPTSLKTARDAGPDRYRSHSRDDGLPPQHF